MDNKKWYLSKTVWTNVIAIIGDIMLRFTGHELPAGSEIIGLGIINTILRFVTKTQVTW